MILLKLQLTLRATQTKPAVAASPFLGGVLHGVFERTVLSHAPIICDELGIMPGSQLKHYAILPPPFGWQTPTAPEPITMHCGIILYGKAKQYTKVVAALLNKWDEIRLEGRIDQIHCHQVQHLIPGFTSPAWHDITQNTTFTDQPNFKSMQQACGNITINLFTPLVLGNKSKITTSTNPLLPTLLQLVRSIVRRIKKLEPDLATALGIDTLAWIEAEEQIRHIPVEHHQLKQVDWKYGSSTKKYLFPCSGLLGPIRYTGHIPAAIMTLLHWGKWFGIGQGSALGQGMYYIEELTINFATE